MGPLDPTPPMVTAGAPDQTQLIADLLRRRTAAAKQAQLSAGNAEMWGGSFQQPQFTQTVGGGRGQPDQVVVNYGDILGKGISNFMQAKERKTAIEKSKEAESLSMEFMNSTLSSDPTAQKLYTAAQAGMPGAEKALAEHMAPKKQSLAVLTQFISGGGDPEMAAQLAARFGIDPEFARRAAEFQVRRKGEESEQEFGQKKELLGLQTEAKKELQASKPTATGYTQAELQAIPIEQRLAAIRAATGRESAESKERGKLKVEAEQELPKTDYAIKNLQDVITFADKATYYPGTGGLVNPKLAANNPNNAMLKQAINQIVLDAAGGKLGGGVSNADVEFLKSATAMLDAGNRDTVVAQLNRILSKMQMERGRLGKLVGEATSSVPVQGPASKFDYRTSKDLRGAPSFEDAWKEVGGE